jgi:hypothetical protein
MDAMLENGPSRRLGVASASVRVVGRVASSQRQAVDHGWQDHSPVAIQRRPRDATGHLKQVRGEDDMTRVLLVGLQPEAVDYSDPVLPPAMDAKKIWAGIDLALKQMTDRGWQADVCLIQPDATGPALERRLRATTYDCVVVGAGVRLPPKNLLLFEIINEDRERQEGGHCGGADWWKYKDLAAEAAKAESERVNAYYEQQAREREERERKQ